MADKWYAVLTPAQDLDSPHWVAIERVQPGGAEAVILGLRLRQMAVQAGFGGLIAKPSGQPMSLNQITLALGYTPERVQHGLNLLHSFDLVKVDDDGGVWSEDPVVLGHLSRQQERQKLLPGPGQGPGRPKKEDALSNAERQKKHREKTKKVTKSNEKGNENSPIISVTGDSQTPEMVAKNAGNENSLNKEVKVIKTSSCTPANRCDDEGIDVAPALCDVPPAERPKVATAIRKACLVGHPLHAAHMTIDEARRQASPGSSWVGLAIHKLGQLAKPDSLPVKPARPANKPFEVLLKEPLPAANTEADEAFERALSDPNAQIYKEMYARITSFAREMGPGDISFRLGMRDAYDELQGLCNQL